MLNVLLSFHESLACIAKVCDWAICLFLNDEPWMVRPTFLDLNPVELKYYPFMISLDNFTGSCNVVSPKICVPEETKNTNVKAFNMITNKSKAKTMKKHISYDCKFKFNSTWCNSNQKLNNKMSMWI